MTALTLQLRTQSYTVSMSRSTVYVVCLLLLLGVYCAYSYLHTVPAACANECDQMHRAVMAGTANSPYRYRVLQAYVADWLTPPGANVMIGYTFAHFLAFPALMLALYAWFRRWLVTATALVGVLIVAALVPVLLQVWGNSLGTPLEAIMLCIGLILLDKQPRSWKPAFALLVLIASFNRETAILLPLAYATTQFTRKRELDYWLWGGVFGAAWLAVFAGLRLTLGAAPDDVPIATAWALNTGGGWHTQEAVFKNLFFIPVWVLYLKQIKGAPLFLKRLTPVALVYLVLFLVFGYWNEVRLHLPLLVLVLPVALRALFPVVEHDLGVGRPVDEFTDSGV